jgi:hypothetical protein
MNVRKVPEHVTLVCEECKPGTTTYCWRCNRNPKVARELNQSQHLPPAPEVEHKTVHDCNS